MYRTGQWVGSDNPGSVYWHPYAADRSIQGLCWHRSLDETPNHGFRVRSATIRILGVKEPLRLLGSEQLPES